MRHGAKRFNCDETKYMSRLYFGNVSCISMKSFGDKGILCHFRYMVLGRMKYSIGFRA